MSLVSYTDLEHICESDPNSKTVAISSIAKDDRGWECEERESREIWIWWCRVEYHNIRLTILISAPPILAGRKSDERNFEMSNFGRKIRWDPIERYWRTIYHRIPLFKEIIAVETRWSLPILFRSIFSLENGFERSVRWRLSDRQIRGGWNQNRQSY